MTSRWILPLVLAGACGGATSDEPTVAREPVDPEPMPTVPEQPPPTPAPVTAPAPPATPCQTACTTLARCEEAGFADAAACDAACQAAADDRAWTCRTHAGTCGAARVCVAPTKVRGRRADARALVAPIAVAAEYRRSDELPPESEAVHYALVIRLTGHDRVVRDLAVATVVMPDVGPVLSIEPAEGGEGPLFVDQRFFAGAGDDFEIVKAADALVVRHRQTDEQAGEGRWRDEARISLPAGAAVTPGSLPL